MDKTVVLSLLKADLEKRNSVNDEYLDKLIDVAVDRIKAEGITLGESVDDMQLVSMYAAYLYRRRTGNNEGYSTEALNPQGMPYMLRLALNNRIFAEAMR